MTTKKVQISDILASLIPDFIEFDNTKFTEFLEQYYISEEHTYGSTYLADNLNEFKRISNLVDVSKAEEQTLPPPNALYPTKPIILALNTLAYDSKIYLAHSNTTVTPAQTLTIPVEGLPDTYGLIKIDNEIITYTNKAFDESTGLTELSGCVRGFSGISEIDNPSNPEFLTFLDSKSDPHEAGTLVVNLNFIFLNKFYEKHKEQFLPGLEKRQFKQGLSSENILSRAKDFYSSKGTDVSLRILFQVLFGEEVFVVKPFDETLIPSEAKWSVTDDMIVEALQGNPLNLVGTKLFQGDEDSPTASGAAENVQQVFLGDKHYYKISFVKGSVINENEPGMPPEFVINSKTQILERIKNKTVVTVDSTVGFPDKDGVFYYLDPFTDYKTYSTVSYGSKSYNQFFDCVGIGSLPMVDGDKSALDREIPILSGNFLYGYEDNDEDKVCEMRIVGSVSGVSANVSSTKYFGVDDTIRVKHLGEKTSLDDPKFNKWFYNNIAEIDISDLPKADPSDTTSDTIVTPVNHFLYVDDYIDVYNADTEQRVKDNLKVESIFDNKRFKISDSLTVGPNYKFRKRLDYVSTGFGITSLLGNIQNTFVDSDGNAYLTCSGYPGFDTNTDNGEKTFQSVGVSTENSQITITNHQFTNGEKVYYKSPTIGITTLGETGVEVYTSQNRFGDVGYGSTFGDGYYFVNKVNNNTIRLCVGQNRIVSEDFELIRYTGVSTSAVHTLTPAKLYESGGLKDQKNFKRILKTPVLAEDSSNIVGPIGISLNGVELHSPVSEDSIFYGPIQSIDILDSGENYDIINPPSISITDSTGSDANLYPSFSGKVEKINLLTSGFDYINTPAVTISGGNGSGTVCKPKMRAYTHSIPIPDSYVSIASSTITLPTDSEGTQLEHKFLDGEEVIYTTDGNPIGITSTNVGFATDRLISSGNYFIAKIDNKSFRLATTKNRALNKTNLIEFNALGTKGHTFRSTKIRKIIDEIVVAEQGSNYINRNVVVDSQNYPPTNKKNLFNTFSGINIIENTIYVRNHGFKSGEVVEYSCGGHSDRILGLNTITQYKVSDVIGDEFKLADIGPTEGANYALGSSRRRNPRLTSHTYESGATSWQQVDDPGTDAGFVGIWLRNLKVGEKYRISLRVDNNALLDGGGRMHRVHSTIAGWTVTGSRTDFTHWNNDGTGTAPIGVLTGEFIAQSENEDEFLFYCNNITVNISDFKVELIDNNYTDYERKIYADLTSIGSGTHTFKYPDIKVNIKGVVSAGTTSNIPSYYSATATPQIFGSVENVYVGSGGTAYGADNTINYSRQPNIELLTGEGAALVPIIEAGAIIDVMILTQGNNYTSAPELQVVGTGTTQGFARLKANVSGGKLVSVDILSGGKNYVRNQTDIVIIPSGKGARFNAEIYEWKFNAVEYYDKYLSNVNNDGMVQVTSPQLFKGAKPCSFYPSKKYRNLIGDNIGDAPTYPEGYTSHGKLLGWAYDGNPIFGTIGGKTGIGVTWMQSSYSIDLVTGAGLRPSLSTWVSGSFVQDYNYDQGGDLDEFNGKFIQPGEVSDFPEGTYAYFSTIDSTTKEPSFPYITLKHHNHTDEFNYDGVRDQSDEYINTGEYKRNVTHLGLNQNFIQYPFLKDALASKVELTVDSTSRSNVTNIDVTEGGSGYNVGNIVKFNDGRINAEISEVLGTEVVSIATTESIFTDVKFAYYDGTITGITTVPHVLNQNENVEISGISSSLYKNIEGFQKVGITTVNTTVAVSIASSTLDTNIHLAGSTLSRKFEIDDEIQINAEKMLVIGIDDVNNRYRVSRGYKGTTPGAHSVDATVNKLIKKFTFDVDGQFENKNIEFPKVKYFVGESSVGIGSTYSSVVVGTAGSSNINKSIPPRAIYLPGHQFKTGDAVTLTGYGSTIWASETVGLGNTFKIADMPNLYSVKLNDEYIGLATVRSYLGLSTAHVYFTGIDTYWGDSQKLETIVDNVTGKLVKVNTTVSVAAATTTGSQHSLVVGDDVRLNITPSSTQNIAFAYNSTIKKLVVNPVSIASTVDNTTEAIASGTNGISTAQNALVIPNHDFETGDVVVYTASNVATPLVNNETYYVIRESEDTIKLANNEYDIKIFPYTNVSIASSGTGSHQIAKVNPKLTVYSGNNVAIAVSDSSLSGYDIGFYSDSNFISKNNSPNITRTGVIGDEDPNTKINISIASSFPSISFYRIEGQGSNYMNTYPNSVDENVPNYSTIEVNESKFNQNYTITGVGDTTFSFTLVGAAETTSYANSGFSSAFYSTNSKVVKGGVHSVKLISSPDNLISIPILTSVGSTTGRGVVFDVKADNIGRIQSVTVPYQGLEFPTDNTLRPKADSNVIFNLKNTLTLSKIGVDTGGQNYANGPEILAINKPLISGRTNLKGGGVNTVDILANDSNLNDSLEIISTNNTNGVGVVNATSGFNITRQQQENKIFIKVPANYTGFTTATFPFQVGENVYVENIDIVGGATSTASGYNSDGYDYKMFKVTAIDVVSDQESVSYSIQGIGNTGGTYDDTNNFGRIIREADLAKFTPEFKKVEFFEGETVKSTSGATGNVSVKGWNPDTDVLKLYNIQGEFKKDDIITGTISNSKSTVNSLFVSDFDLSVDSVVESVNNWRNDTGKLNLDNQRVHDNDYYQRFSYAIKGDVPYAQWKDPVDSLTHIAGFKNFANLGITSSVSAGLQDDGDLEVRIDLSSESSLWERPWFDYVTEITGSNKFSKIIKFDNKVITDYNESVTNKVLLINDLSSQFTGKTSTFTGEHRFVTADTDGIKIGVGGTIGNLTATNGTIYNPTVGILTVTTTITHGLSNGDIIFFDDYSVTFKCSEDNFTTNHPYPRPTDPASTSNTKLNSGLLEVSNVTANTFSVTINTPITGGQIVGLSTFTLNTNISGTDYSLLHHSFNPSTSTDVSDIVKHSFNIPNHYFNSGEVIHYSPKTAGNSIGIVTTTVAGIGATDKLPPTLYAIRDDNDNFRVAVSKADAVDTNGIGVTFVTSGGSVPSYGGDGHTFSVPTTGATARSMILVDNIMQSPLARRPIPLTLSAPIGVSTDLVYVTDSTKLEGKTFVQINNEIIKINTVGIGSTTTLEVTRGVLGTQSGVHTVGAGITALSGDYRIDKGTIHFTAPPYGKSGVSSTSSSFRGRIFYRQDYTDNYIVDDVSDTFTGSASQFTLQSNGTNLPVGVGSFFGMILVNNIFQRPWYADLGNSSDNDYIVGTGLTVTFTGSAANGDLPRGGIINEFSVGIGSGYQIPTKALATPVVSAAGTIASVAINTAGQGYIESPRVSIGVTYAHYVHQFVSATNNAVNVTGGSELTPTFAEYDSATGNLTLVIAGHGLTNANTITLDNYSLKFKCSRDAFTSAKLYPRPSDPASTSNGELNTGVLPIINYSTDAITVFVGKGAGTGASFNAHISAGIVTSITVTNPGSGYTTSDMPMLTIDEPAPYNNLPLTGGSGSNATMDVVVGTGGSVLSFAINNRGIGYEVGENLELYGLPVQAGIGTSAFNITIENEYKDKFASWNFGKFLEMDDFSELFNGFKKTFLITRTTASKEYYSIDKKAGSGIVLANNLLLFLNDVLQMPGEDYVFDKGTKISFKEAPPKGSKFKFYLYVGSDQDVNEVDVEETVKVGDLLQIRAGINTLATDPHGRVENKNLNFPPSQERRTIHELTASDLVNTNTYYGQGILPNSDFSRPVVWTKQREDKIIDSLLVSKERDYLEPQIYPATKVIKSFSATDTTVYVEDTYAFHLIDASVGSVLNDVRISGLATAATESWISPKTGNTIVTSPRPHVEVLQNCTYTGDFGQILGITTHTSGVGTATPSIKFTIKPDPSIYNSSPSTKQRDKSGITTGDYFVVRNTVIGNAGGGTTSLNTGVNDIVSIGKSFIDNVYYANTWVSYAGTAGAITVTCNVNSLSGINTLGLTTVPNLGTYSWGTINVANRPTNGKAFEVNQVGLATDTIEASRTLQVMLESEDIR